MNVTNSTTTTTNNSRRLRRHNDVDSTFEELKDEADETDASSHAPGTLRDYETKYYEVVRWLKRKNVRDALNSKRLGHLKIFAQLIFHVHLHH